MAPWRYFASQHLNVIRYPTDKNYSSSMSVKIFIFVESLDDPKPLIESIGSVLYSYTHMYSNEQYSPIESIADTDYEGISSFTSNELEIGKHTIHEFVSMSLKKDESPKTGFSLVHVDWAYRSSKGISIRINFNHAFFDGVHILEFMKQVYKNVHDMGGMVLNYEEFDFGSNAEWATNDANYRYSTVITENSTRYMNILWERMEYYNIKRGIHMVSSEMYNVQLCQQKFKMNSDIKQFIKNVEMGIPEARQGHSIISNMYDLYSRFPKLGNFIYWAMRHNGPLRWLYYFIYTKYQMSSFNTKLPGLLVFPVIHSYQNIGDLILYKNSDRKGYCITSVVNNGG